jgi:hypothetical protein
MMVVHMTSPVARGISNISQTTLAATCKFAERRAATTSPAVNPRSATFAGSSQTLIE